MDIRIVTSVALTAVASLSAISLAEAQVDERLWGISMVGADRAWANGFTGKGVKIGIMDQAAQPDHPEYAERWLGGFNVDGSSYGPYDPIDFYHGTHVAGTIGGRRVGVAPSSEMYGFNWSVMNTDLGYSIGFDQARALGVRAVNNSWGLNMIDPVTGMKRSRTIADTDLASLDNNLLHTLPALRAAVAADIIQVFATGNSAMPQPGVLAGLPYFYPELQQHWLAVTAVGPSGGIASYAERCGWAANWCLAGPGGDGASGTNEAIWSSWPGSGYFSIEGTSMATPHVTGAVAIAAEIFPHASGAELTRMILQTATDIGAAGIDEIYGWGLLNVGNIVDSINPRTLRAFTGAAWSRDAALGHVSTALRSRLVRSQQMNGDATNGTANRLWAAPIHGRSFLADGPGTLAASSTTSGVVVGADLIDDAHLNLGLAAGYANTLMKARHAADKAAADSYHLGIYGYWHSGGWFVDGTGQIAFYDQTVERHTISGATGTSVAPVGLSTIHGHGVDLSLRSGYEIETTAGHSFAPYIAFAARWQHADAVSEIGAGIFAVNLPASSYRQFEVGPGARFESSAISLQNGQLRVAVDMSYSRLLEDVDYAATATLLGRTVETSGAEIGRDVLRVGAQLDFTTNEQVRWAATYSGSFQKRATTHTFGAGVAIRF